jgi:ABC-type amino acid transport substrate-binding protein
MVETAIQSFAAVGMASQYRVTGWRRALRNVAVGKMDVLLGADASMANKLYLDDQFTVRDETLFLASKDANIPLDADIDLERYRIGIISEYTYTDAESWAKAIENHPNQLKLSSSNGERRLIELLLSGRVDIALVNRHVAAYELGDLAAHGLVATHRSGMVSTLYMGFTKNIKGKKLRAAFQRGFGIIKANGELEKIYRRYHIDYPY